MKNTLFAAAFAAFAVQASAADLELSLQAYSFRDRSFVETVETAARLGYKNIEAYPGQRLGGGMPGSTDYNSIRLETLAQLKAYLAKAHVKVVSYGVTGANGEAQWRRLTAFCKELGIGLVQVEVGISPENLRLGAKIAGEAGVRIGLHNHRQPAGRPEAVLKALEGAGPTVGASSDIGHWQNSGVNPVDGVKILKGRFFSIHAIDASGPKAGNKDVALGSGVIDLVTIMNELKKNEKGTVYITVEDEWQHDDLESAVAASARWFNAWKRGELAADGRVRADAIAGLWKDVDAANPSGWDAKALGLVDDIAPLTSLRSRATRRAWPPTRTSTPHSPAKAASSAVPGREWDTFRATRRSSLRRTTTRSAPRTTILRAIRSRGCSMARRTATRGWSWTAGTT